MNTHPISLLSILPTFPASCTTGISYADGMTAHEAAQFLQVS
jgi:hypothetical protein